MGYGLVPEHAQDVPDEALLAVQDRARGLVEVLAPLEGADDAVLVAYGANQDATTTGVLGSSQPARQGAGRRATGRPAPGAPGVGGACLARHGPRATGGAGCYRDSRRRSVLDLRTELLATDAQDRTLGAPHCSGSR